MFGGHSILEHWENSSSKFWSHIDTVFPLTPQQRQGPSAPHSDQISHLQIDPSTLIFHVTCWTVHTRHYAFLDCACSIVSWPEWFVTTHSTSTQGWTLHLTVDLWWKVYHLVFCSNVWLVQSCDHSFLFSNHKCACGRHFGHIMMRYILKNSHKLAWFSFQLKSSMSTKLTLQWVTELKN